ncbi:hypothetical protein CEXT_737271 [Caerostris extrusa]|uniref:Uncharacterized protein n=1 Tax=Caerostris extrusa TaxID=172846 RepID=A0AAV4WUM4_CAEEX|nr:hypothetical protein CEXT_737271 [Caerostris extrusa]
MGDDCVLENPTPTSRGFYMDRFPLVSESRPPSPLIGAQSPTHHTHLKRNLEGKARIGMRHSETIMHFARYFVST